MADGLTDDDPSMGQGGPPADTGGGPPSPPAPGGGGGPPGPGMAAFARSRMGPQVSAPGPGNMADSMNMVIQAINILKQAGMGLPPGNRLHADIYRTISSLSRHLGGVAAIGPAAGMQKTMLGDQLRRTVQNQLLSRIQAMMAGKGGPGAQGGQPAATPPMPSTPLPGS